MSWKAIYQAFDPRRPATEPGEREERAYSPVPDLNREVNREFGRVHALLLGSLGTGKSTELWRMLHDQSGLRRVVYLDVAQHFERQGRDAAIADVQPWELLALVAVAALRAAEAYGIWDQGEIAAFDKALKDLVPAPQRPPPIADLVAAIGEVVAVAAPVTGEIVKRLSSTVKWELPLGRDPMAQIPDDDARIQALLHATNRALLALGRVGAPPLLLLDGLDRQDSYAPEAYERTFIRSVLLGEFECHTVVMGPMALRRGQRLLEVRGLEPYLIAEVPVVRREDPRKPNPEGLAFFRGLWARRAGAHASHIPPELIDVLAFNSAGRVREFMRLIRDVCNRAGGDVATEIEIDAVLKSYRYHVVEAMLTDGMIRVLRHVLATGALPDDPLVDKLIRNLLIVAYPNNEEWYSPHPILLRGRLAG